MAISSIQFQHPVVKSLYSVSLLALLIGFNYQVEILHPGQIDGVQFVEVLDGPE